MLFQSNLRKQIRKLPKILKFVRINTELFTIIQNYSLVSLGARRSAGATPPAADAAALVAASLGAPRSDAAPSTYVISRKWWPTAARSRRAVLAGPCSAGLS